MDIAFNEVVIGGEKTADLKYGDVNEAKVHPMIEEYFGSTVMNTKMTKGKYCVYDYESLDLTTRYELKSRRVKHNAYPTTIIQQHKITQGAVGAERLILLFLFTDGLYHIVYEPMLFSTFDKSAFTRWRDGRPENQIVYNIPIKCLTKVVL